MAKIRTLQIYRGTTAQNDAYTGSVGELTMDTTTNELRLHDGSTAGGHKIGGGSSYHPDLFAIQWADHQLNDVQWLRADTFSWQDGSVYQAAYAHLEDDIDGKTLQSETIAGITIQFYLADDGHKICPASEESNVASIYSATGVAWYYIIDTVNERFKLPRTKFGLTGLRGNVGDYVEAGLPNITGRIDLTGISNHTTSTYNSNDISGSALYNNESITAGRYHTDSSSTTGYNRIRIDASRSSSIYGNSTTVQPQATQMYLYFYVGEFTQTSLENTAGLNAELFNGKVDIGHQVIEFQEPNAGNNYTWYRKYADGWVEQGGVGTGNNSFTLPVEMSDTNYTLIGEITQADNASLSLVFQSKATTGFWARTTYSGSAFNYGISWQVSGMAA